MRIHIYTVLLPVGLARFALLSATRDGAHTMHWLTHTCVARTHVLVCVRARVRLRTCVYPRLCRVYSQNGPFFQDRRGLEGRGEERSRRIYDDRINGSESAR